MGERTWEDFVEDMLDRGRSIKHIVAVALNTQWRANVAEIRVYAKKLRSLYQRKPKKDIGLGHDMR